MSKTAPLEVSSGSNWSNWVDVSILICFFSSYITIQFQNNYATYVNTDAPTDLQALILVHHKTSSLDDLFQTQTLPSSQCCFIVLTRFLIPVLSEKHSFANIVNNNDKPSTQKTFLLQLLLSSLLINTFVVWFDEIVKFLFSSLAQVHY